jgi:hypothetical protein
MNKCNICQNEINYIEGGAALMMAFVRGHTTNLINVSVCETCYKIFMDKPMRMLNDNCLLNVSFGEEDGEQK